MKIAFCLYGIVGAVDGKHGKGRDIDPRIGHMLHDKYIFQPNKKHDIDIFMHSWSTQFEELLIDLYKPKNHIIEPQIDFKQKNLRLNCIKSRWYSTKKSIELKTKYEQKKGFEYDFVIIYRFDCGFTNSLVFEKFNSNNFYVSHRDDCTEIHCRCGETKRFYDTWFFSNSQNMDKFSTLYDHWEEYGIKDPHSECAHHIHQIGLGEDLQHTFYEISDHNNVRAMFENCQYDSTMKFDVTRLKPLPQYPKHRFK
tara:strand:+ start:517 stop:1275 length:759 start_codon:yes stop_codon:yes gene_type:complete